MIRRNDAPTNDYLERRAVEKREQADEVGRAVQQAVARALAAVDQNRVVVINLTVQYASGGGATNIVGDDTRPNGHR